MTFSLSASLVASIQEWLEELGLERTTQEIQDAVEAVNPESSEDVFLQSLSLKLLAI